MASSDSSDATFRGTGSLEAALANGRHLLRSDPEGAARQAEEILKVSSSSGDALRLLGRALRRLGRDEEAERAELQAIQSSSANATLVAAAQAIKAREFAQAEHLLRPYLDGRPDDAAAVRMLAEIAIQAGAEDQAETLLRRAIELAPGFHQARLALAALLSRASRPAEAIEQADAVLLRQPENMRALATKAAGLSRIGGYEEAAGLYGRLTEMEPGHPQSWMSYGHVLKTLGRTGESVVAYRRALEIDPTMGEVWWSLANLKTVRLGDEDIAAMRGALSAEDLSEEARFHLLFALGKACEDAGRHEEGFRDYSAGNLIRRSLLPYEADWITDQVRRSEATFTPAFFDARRGWGVPDADPIFIVGMPRAGSTLIEQILASHSMIEGTSELPYIQVLAQRAAAKAAAGSTFPDWVASMSAAEAQAMGEEYLGRARPHRKTDRPFFIDKLPNNWTHVGLVQLILPNARIVDARRHPLSCCFSNFKQHFAHGQAFAYDLADLGRYYRDYVRLMAHFDAVLPGRVHRVIHEQLVEDEEGEIRRMLGYLGLPFEEACLRFYENDRAVRTPSAEQVRRPINREGFDQWKPFEPWLSPLKEELGPVLESYPLVPDDV